MDSSKIKQKTCKYCKNLFDARTPLQAFCLPSCFWAYSKEQKRKKTMYLKKIGGVDETSLTKKADKLLQEKYTYGKCESCGIREATCCHHYVYKSQSNFLRYNLDNLVRICPECHTRHHKSGDSEIMSRVIVKRGIEWEQGLQSQRRTPQKLTVSYLQEIIKQLTS